MIGRHSLKTGYEFQHIQTEVQDVNPLYGRDAYAGQFTPPGRRRAANNLYNLADFMFGLRSRRTRSATSWSPTCGRTCTSLYLQDDFRVNDQLTLNLGLRYEYATPGWEKDNILSNFDPATRTMVLGAGRVARGSLDASTPIATTSARASASPARSTPRTVVRGGYGISYVHFHRAGGANVLPINGPQVINAVVVQTTRLEPAFRTTQQGYPAGFTDPSQLQPAGRQHHLHARGLPLEPRAELVRLGAARARRATCSSTSPTSATAPTACCCSPTSTRPRRTTPPARSRCRRAGRSRSSPTSPTRSTAASRATTPSRCKFDWRHARAG